MVEDSPRTRTSTERRQDGVGHRSRKSGGFLLDAVYANGQPSQGTPPERRGKEKAQDGHLQVEKRRLEQTRSSMDSSHASSPLSREVSMDDIDRHTQQRPSRPPSMDPAQLVQMALNLSESRKRHVSGPLHVPLTSPRDSRRLSGRYDTVHTRSSGRQRASYLSDDRSYGSASPHMLDSADQGYAIHDQDFSDVVANDVPYNFSPATLSRAEKARKYFELASEHRRLLQNLPPLKADANAPGNHIFVSKSSPHSVHPEIERVPSYSGNKYPLGRQYNPLQALRNRRLRARERRPLTAPLEAWADTARVRSWVDGVEAATDQSEYRALPDRVQLPAFEQDDERAAASRNISNGHRRTDTVSSVITRPENGWSIEPPELLADTYWTEDGDNKDTIENRSGYLVFPARTRSSIEQPRPSHETNREVIKKDTTDDATDDMPARKRTHRRTLLLPKRHRRKQVSRSPSVTSASSDEGRVPRTLSYGSDGGENIGPLERQMQRMIVRDERGELSSPDLVSPDHWESKHTPFPVLRGNVERPHRDTLSQDNGRLSVDTAQSHRRAKSADGRYITRDRPMLSMEDVAATDSPDFETLAGTDNQSPTKQQKSNKWHKFSHFRSHSKNRNNIDQTDFAVGAETKPSNAFLEPRPSQESARPSFISRHRTTDSVASSLRRQGTGTTEGSIKEPSSTVGRFFKGGRIGDLVRNESSRFGDRFRGRDRLEDARSDLSDLEDAGEQPLSVTDESDVEPRQSVEQPRAKPKYFLQNLPSFTSPRGRSSADNTPGEDPITQQQRAQRAAGRSPRFDRLAPPRINLPTDSNDEGDESGVGRRKSYGGLDADRVTFDVAPTDSAHDMRLDRLRSQGQRHWSISDRAQPAQASKVTARDVARVQALLLSSGVKAREIRRRADSTREAPLPVIESAAAFVGRDFGQLCVREEHIVASRALSDSLSSTLSAFDQTLRDFQSGPSRSLATQLDELQRKAADQLTKVVHETSDDADAYIVELTTKQPQDIKRVDDAIDELLRQRRRQFRLLRRAGFKLLEWLVLGIMWWVWFLVVLFNTAKKSMLGVLRLFKWLFSF